MDRSVDRSLRKIDTHVYYSIQHILMYNSDYVIIIFFFVFFFFISCMTIVEISFLSSFSNPHREEYPGHVSYR